MKQKTLFILLLLTTTLTLSACFSTQPQQDFVDYDDSYDTEYDDVIEDSNTTSENTSKEEESKSESDISESENHEEAAAYDQTADSNEVSADFKAAMDSYEKFFNEYVAIMKKYTNDPSDMSILDDYIKYMGEYAETMSDFEKWENEDMNAAEVAYYLEVQGRITKKLLEVAY